VLAEFARDRHDAFDEIGDVLAELAALSRRRANVHAGEPVPGGEPFVFDGDPVAAHVAALGARAFLQEPQRLDHQALHEGDDPEGMAQRRRRVAHAQLDGAEVRARANVPVNVLERANGLAGGHHLAEIAELLPAREIARHARVRQQPVERRAARLQAGVHALPEG
jgi:hypothetical protein